MIVIIWISSQFKLVEDWFNARTVWSQKKPLGGSCVRTVSTARMVIITIITNITYVMIVKIVYVCHWLDLVLNWPIRPLLCS